MYPSTHVLLTFNWNTAGGERAQTGLRFNRSTLPTLTEMNALHAAWGIMWNAANTRINSEFGFTNVKAAVIRPDGTYPPSTDPIYSTAATVYGGTVGGPYFPLQVGCVASLETNLSRGLASKGRMYLPPIANVISNASFRWNNTLLDQRGATVASCITALNGVMGTPALVMSKQGAGANATITGVRVGNRPDIHRSRDNAVPETYGVTTAV